MGRRTLRSVVPVGRPIGGANRGGERIGDTFAFGTPDSVPTVSPHSFTEKLRDRDDLAHFGSPLVFEGLATALLHHLHGAVDARDQFLEPRLGRSGKDGGSTLAAHFLKEQF